MPDQNLQEVQGGVREMGTDESGRFAIDVANIASSITGTPSIVRAYDESDPTTDLKETLFGAGPPAPSVAATVITLPALTPAAAPTMYRTFVTFNDGTNDWVVFLRVWVPTFDSTQRLLTVPQLLEHLETDLPGSALYRLIEDADREIVDAYGAHTLSGTVTETLRGGLRTVSLGRPYSAITSVTEEVDGGAVGGVSSTVLSADDYRSWWGNRALERRADGTNSRSRWGDRVIVVYTPVDQDARRRRVCLDLVRLAAGYEGVQSMTAGDVTVSAVDYAAERGRILATLANTRSHMGIH